MNAANNVNGVGNCPRGSVRLKHAADGRATGGDAENRERIAGSTTSILKSAMSPIRRRDHALATPHRGRNPRHGRELGVKHLISMNIANGRTKVENPHPGVSIFNFHYCTPPDTVDLNYGLNKFSAKTKRVSAARMTCFIARKVDVLLAGGALYNNLDYSFTPHHPAGSLVD